MMVNRLAVEFLDYGLDCRIQNLSAKPRKENVTFPTVVANIGYAPKDEPRKHKRLRAKNSSDIVKVEYSFNEVTLEVEHIQLADSGEILAYSLSDLIAEKYRAILQQEIRKRFRRQDAYDIYYLLQNYSPQTLEDKAKILDSLRKKSMDRNVPLGRYALREENTKNRSRKEYHLLSYELPGPPPDFDKVYDFIQAFYESLPWSEF